MKPSNKTYGRLTRENDTWIITDLQPNVSMRLKANFPRLSKGSTKSFWIPNTTINAADILWFMTRYPLEISTKDLNHLKRQSRTFHKNRDQADTVLSPSYTPPPRTGLRPNQVLRRYQHAAVSFVELVKRCIIADDLGLGKTYEGLAIALLRGALPTVIVCEPQLQTQWGQKAEEFIDLTVYLPQGNTPYKLPPADIYIFKYSQLSPWVDHLATGWIKAIVFDEVQQLRTGITSAKGEAAKAICESVEYCVGLTATPTYNYGTEIWHIYDIIAPGALGTFSEFEREWCTQIGKKVIVKEPHTLGAYLRESQIFLRRTKRDVGSESKQVAPHIEWVTPDTNRVKQEEELTKKLAMAALTSPERDIGLASAQFDIKLRELTGIAKARSVAAYARMFVESGTPIILFGWHKAVYKIWKEELNDLNPLFYTGNENPSQKEKNKQAFINGKSNLFIMSLRSGAGVDGLQRRCSTAIHGELDYSPKVHEQCNGRLDREGQQEEVFVFFAVCEFGSDPAILDILGVKESQGRGIIDPGSEPIRRNTVTDRIRQTAQAYLKLHGIDVPEDQITQLSNKSAKDIEKEILEAAALL